jgi:hypothetical protein
MDSALGVLAMVGSLLILGWLVGSGAEHGKHVRSGEKTVPEGLRTDGIDLSADRIRPARSPATPSRTAAAGTERDRPT